MEPIQKSLRPWAERVRMRLAGGARDERGAVAVIFAVALVLLAPLVLGVIDIYQSSSQRSRLQDALDAAALYTARSTATTAEEISAAGLKALNANLSAADQARLVSTHFALDGSTIVASAELRPDSVASELWSHGNMRVNTNVVRASSNLEVSMVLDITGSMGGDMDALKAAGKDLVDLVVQDVQTPYYTKLAVVPYSNAVNVSTAFIDGARGAATAAKSITSGSRSKVSGIYYITFTAPNHGFSDGDYVVLSDVSGQSGVNGNLYQVGSVTTNSFKITYGSSNPGSSSTGGQAHCTNYGCDYYRFTNASSSPTLYQASTQCVTERTGSNKYNDTAPGSSHVGFHYTSSLNDCPATSIVPLSTDKTSLKATVDTLSSGGSTAGHIGVAWGWYMVSPNFGSLWPSASNRPAAYGAEDVLKVVVLMTDGDFNTAYCHGVLANNSGYGNNNSQINCNAENDTSTNQARALCTNMKAQGIIIYTVGFRISSGSTAANTLSHCATDGDHQYLPASGQDLQEAFRAIGQDINSLRLAH